MEGNRTTSSGMATKHSKASLTSVSPCRKNPDKSVPKNILRQTQLCYRMSDVVISLVVIFPLVIGFWRGVWNLMEYYSTLYDADPWLSIAIGYTIPFLLYWLQEPLRKHIRPRKMNYVLFYCISRYLLLLHSFGSVNQWRGLWALLDQYTGVGFYSAVSSLIIGVILSVALKTFCNVLAPPLYVAVDEAYAIHDCPLRYHTKPKFKFRYFMDCIVSVFVTASLIVSCWRGLWELADLYVFPDDAMLSALASLCFGYLVVLLLFICQPYIHKSMENLQGFSHLIVANTVTFVGFFGCVFAWRGLWMIYDEQLGTPNVSDWATTIIGAAGCLVLGCVSTIIVRGVAVDGEQPDDGTSEWPIPYVSLLRDSIYDVPFPEPWLFRYLCTSQKMNFRPAKTKDSKVLKGKESKSEKDGSGVPLNKAANANAFPASSSSSPNPESNPTPSSVLKGNLNSSSINLRNIDSSCSSSEDEEDTTAIVTSSNPKIVRIGSESQNQSEGVGGGSQVKIKVTGSSDSFELKPLRKVNNGDVENANNVSDVEKGQGQCVRELPGVSTYLFVEGGSNQASNIPKSSSSTHMNLPP